jgi:RGM family protein
VGGIGQFPSLSISIQTPRPLVPRPDAKTTELCVVGCPAHSTLSHPDQSLRLDVEGQQAAKACLRRGLTDAFLDACVFDLMSTGDFGFAEAAQLAQTDFWAMNPRLAGSTLSNRTEPLPELLVASGGTKLTIPSFIMSFILFPLLRAFS